MKRGFTATIASASALTLAAFVPLGTAMAQEGDAVITNTETVNVSLDPAGNVDVARVYDQIAVQGSGTVDYANPVSTVGLRNLDSFGGFTVEDDSIVEETDVDGQLRRRAVSDFDLELPITIVATYTAWTARRSTPADLVGKSGEVEVTYTDREHDRVGRANLGDRRPGQRGHEDSDDLRPVRRVDVVHPAAKLHRRGVRQRLLACW